MSRMGQALFFLLSLVAIAACNSPSSGGETTTTTPSSTTSSTTTTVPPFLERVWTFDRPADFDYDPEVVTLGAGGVSQAELTLLPADMFWESTYASPLLHRGPEYHACALDASGNIIAVGSLANFTAPPGELMMGKYRPNGQSFDGWPKFYQELGFRWNEAQNVLVDAAGNIDIAGYSITDSNQWWMTIWRFDANGNILPGWPRHPIGNNGRGTGIVLDEGGDLICCGGFGPTGYENLVLARLTPDGDAVSGWPKLFQAESGLPTFGFNLILDADGDLVVAGYTKLPAAPSDALLVKFKADGSLVPGWPKTWDSGAAYFDEFYTVSQDPNGEYCAVGRCFGTDVPGVGGGGGRLLVARYDKAGNLIASAGWPKIDEETEVYRDNSIDVWKGFVDTAGNVAVAATYGPVPYVRTVKYDRAAGMMAGFPKLLQKPGLDVATRGCGIDALDNIFVVGYSHTAGAAESAADYSTFVIKYPPADYSTGRPAVAAKEGISFVELGGFAEKRPPASTGTVGYQLSPDGETWYFYDGTNWAKATGKKQTNTAAEVNAAIDKFVRDAGVGTLRIRIFLISDGAQRVELTSVSVLYRS